MFNEIFVERKKAVITGLILLILYFFFIYLAGFGPDGERIKAKPTKIAHALAAMTATPQEIVNVAPLSDTATPTAYPFQAAVSSFLSTGSIWRFLRFDPNEVGLFEKIDEVGVLLKAKCQQPHIPSPQPGTLYRLENSMILTPVDAYPVVQIFAVVE